MGPLLYVFNGYRGPAVSNSHGVLYLASLDRECVMFLTRLVGSLMIWCHQENHRRASI